MKRFLEWIGLKARLDEKVIQSPHVNEGDVWWTCVGENVGKEINGKSHKFSRPVVVLKKLARGFYFVIPTTTKLKEGTWYIQFRHQAKIMAACLHQARAIDHRRLWSKIGRLDDVDFSKIKAGFIDLYS